MLVTCLELLSWCQQYWLNTSWTMQSTSWLNSWFGHILAHVLPNNYPAISMACCAVTQKEMVIECQNKRVFMFILTFMKPSSHLSFTKLHHCDMIFCEALHFSLCPKEWANILSYVLSTRHFMSFVMVQLTEFDDVCGKHSQLFLTSSQYVIWDSKQNNMMPKFLIGFDDRVWRCVC